MRYCIILTALILTAGQVAGQEPNPKDPRDSGIGNQTGGVAVCGNGICSPQLRGGICPEDCGNATSEDSEQASTNILDTLSQRPEYLTGAVTILATLILGVILLRNH